MAIFSKIQRSCCNWNTIWTLECRKVLTYLTLNRDGLQTIFNAIYYRSRCPHVNKYNSTLQTTSYYFSSTNTTQEVCVGQKNPAHPSSTNFSIGTQSWSYLFVCQLCVKKPAARWRLDRVSSFFFSRGFRYSDGSVSDTISVRTVRSCAHFWMLCMHRSILWLSNWMWFLNSSRISWSIFQYTIDETQNITSIAVRQAWTSRNIVT